MTLCLQNLYNFVFFVSYRPLWMAYIQLIKKSGLVWRMQDWKGSGNGLMGHRWPPCKKLNSSLTTSENRPVFMLIVYVPPFSAGSGVKTSPTALTVGTRTVWSSGTVQLGRATGMMRTVIWNKISSVRSSLPVQKDIYIYLASTDNHLCLAYNKNVKTVNWR